MSTPPLILAGSGRSGTTWLLDVLAESNMLRPIFEPLNMYGVPEAKLYANRYIRRNDVEPDLKRFMGKIFRGDLNYLWPNMRILPSALRLSWRKGHPYNYNVLAIYKLFFKRYVQYLSRKKYPPIVKLIRANLMVEWINSNFDSKIVFVIRHPGAVAASKMIATASRGGYAWDYKDRIQQQIFNQYRCDKALIEDYLSKYTAIFSENLSEVSFHVLLWCIENIYPMYLLQKRNQQVFFYEDLVLDPVKELSSIMEIFGLETSRINHSKIIEPSQEASRQMKKLPFGETLIKKWKKYFTHQQLDEMETILQFFNVNIYSAYDVLPINRVQRCL